MYKRFHSLRKNLFTPTILALQIWSPELHSFLKLLVSLLANLAKNVAGNIPETTRIRLHRKKNCPLKNVVSTDTKHQTIEKKS